MEVFCSRLLCLCCSWHVRYFVWAMDEADKEANAILATLKTYIKPPKCDIDAKSATPSHRTCRIASTLIAHEHVSARDAEPGAWTVPLQSRLVTRGHPPDRHGETWSTADKKVKSLDILADGKGQVQSFQLSAPG